MAEHHAAQKGMSEGFARQRKVLQMKRFRRDAAAKKVNFSEADKRTMV